MKQLLPYLVLAVMAMATVVNFLLHRGGDRSQFKPLTQGDSIRVTLTGVEGGGVPPTTECRVAYVIHPSCGACRRLGAWYETAQIESEPIWISVADRALTTEYMSTHGIPSSHMYVIGDGGSETALRDLGILGVPTRIVFREGKVQRLTTGVRNGDAPFPDPACVGAP